MFDTIFDRIEKASHRVNRIFALAVCGFSLIFITFMVCTEALARNFFKFSFLGTQELSQIIVTWVVFPALAFALINGTHVRVTLMTRLLRPGLRAGCEIFSYLVGLIFFACFSYYAWPYFWQSWKIKEFPMAPVELPLWLAKLAMPIGTTLFSIQFLIFLIRTLYPSRPEK
ncbi:MAG: TRAP transporter small permease subunit [Deltaproteobacteria bacterium]|nr:TRAP transporter small permease subunit [Deltaproteobacteria bacterium]